MEDAKSYVWSNKVRAMKARVWKVNDELYDIIKSMNRNKFWILTNSHDNRLIRKCLTSDTNGANEAFDNVRPAIP